MHLSSSVPGSTLQTQGMVIKYEKKFIMHCFSSEDETFEVQY